MSGWSFLYAGKTFGITRDIPGWLDSRVQAEEMRTIAPIPLVPFLAIQGDANRCCFNPNGAIVYWDQDEPDAPEPVHMGLAEILHDELMELTERTQRKVREQKGSAL